MVDLISTPVTSGFTTATSIIIVLSQVKGILGVRFKGDSVKDIVEKLYVHFGERRNGDIVLGVSSIALILIMRVSVHAAWHYVSYIMVEDDWKDVVHCRKSYVASIVHLGTRFWVVWFYDRPVILKCWKHDSIHTITWNETLVINKWFVCEK